MKPLHFLLPILLPLAGPALRAEDGPLDINPALVDSLLSEAAGRNPSVLAAGARAEAATDAVESVRTWEDPLFTFGLWGSTARGMRASQEGDIVYGIEQKLPLFGHPMIARHVAEARAEKERLGIGYATDVLRRDITLSLLDIALTDRGTDLAGQHLEWVETTLASVDSRYRTGRSSQVEWLAVQTERAETAEELATLKAMRASQEEQADRLLYRERYTRWPLLGLPSVASPVIYDDRIVAAALAFAPKLNILRQEAVRSEMSAHLTRHMRMPEVGVGLQTRQYSGDAGFREGTVSVNLSLPWVNSGRYDSDERRDKALVRAAERDADAYANQVREDVHHFCVDLDTARRRALLYRDQLIPLAEQALSSAQSAWESNQGRFQDILETHRALIADRLALAQATADQRREMAELTLLTGVIDLPATFGPTLIKPSH